jgi:hypothetical protein
MPILPGDCGSTMTMEILSAMLLIGSFIFSIRAPCDPASARSGEAYSGSFHDWLS